MPGREGIPRKVTLIAVSKTKPVSMMMEAYGTGIRDFRRKQGPGAFGKKSPRCRRIPGFNLIGHLQTNKVSHVIDKTVLIHSVDSLHLAEKIEQEAAKRDLISEILLEVNVAREASKFGMFVEDVTKNLEIISGFPHIRVRGLMTLLQM